jgi:hypothetical protein
MKARTQLYALTGLPVAMRCATRLNTATEDMKMARL